MLIILGDDSQLWYFGRYGNAEMSQNIEALCLKKKQSCDSHHETNYDLWIEKFLSKRKQNCCNNSRYGHTTN